MADQSDAVLSAPIDPSSIRLLVANDNALIRGVMADTLEQRGYQVAARAADGRATLELALERDDLDAVISDIRTPHIDGIEMTRRLSEAKPGLPVILHTSYDDAAHAQDALRAGARGYLRIGCPLEMLERAIRITVAGGGYVDPVLAAKIVKGGAWRIGDGDPRAALLLRLLLQGVDHEQIALQMETTPDALETEIWQALRALPVAPAPRRY